MLVHPDLDDDPKDDGQHNQDDAHSLAKLGRKTRAVGLFRSTQVGLVIQPAGLIRLTYHVRVGRVVQHSEPSECNGMFRQRPTENDVQAKLCDSVDPVANLHDGRQCDE